MEGRYVTLDESNEDAYIGLHEQADVNVTAARAGTLLLTLSVGMWRIYEVNVEGKWYIKAVKLW